MAAAGRGDSKACHRPPGAPKPGLLKGRQHSTGSMSVKLGAASAGGEEQLAAKQWNGSELELGLDARELIVSQSILHDVDVCSKSAPESEVTTPDLEARLNEANIEELSPVSALSVTNHLRITQNLSPLPPPPSCDVLPDPHETKVVNTERSFISGIKERIQGMQDPLQAFTGKIEDFIVEKGIMDPRKSRKTGGESADGKTIVNSNSSTKLSEANKRRSASQSNGESSASEPSQRNSDLVPTAIELDDLTRPRSEPNEKPGDSTPKSDGKLESFLKQRPASFDLSGEYYEVVADDYLDAPIFDDGAAGSQVGVFPKSCSMDTINRQLAQSLGKESPKKIKATLQKLIQPIASRNHAAGGTAGKCPTSAANQNVTISLSGLLNNSASDADDGSVSAESDQFCDPPEEPPLPSAAEPAVGQPPKEAAPSVGDPLSASGRPRAAVKLAYYPSKQKLLAVLAALLAYVVVPLPAYVAGMISGALLASVAILTYLWWTSPPKRRQPFVLPDLSSLPPLQVPEMKESKNDENEFKGWMNELYHYDKDDYHIGQTHSVLVHLEGTNLRLQTPKYNIPKRAFWDEPSYHSSVFIKQRHYDLRGARVLLLPENLVRKRLWSKKYPICLVVPKERRSVSPAGSDTSDGRPELIRIYLFARCTRDKEEWFRRFEAAAANKPLPTRLISVLSGGVGGAGGAAGGATGVQTHRRMSSSSSLDTFVMNHRRKSSADSNISDPGKESAAPSLSYCDTSHEKRLAAYLRYMARVIPAESQERLQAQAKDSSAKQGAATYRLPTAIRCEPQVAWVNALITRCFWDFLREEYWVTKIREKIQKKIGKIHIPWFIDDLTVTGCQLGSEMPVIRRASKPYIDDRGLWIDLDIAYTGGFRLQLETKCNLMKLKQKPSELIRVPESENTRSPITDSEEEDSAESSTDEEACEENVEDEKLAGTTQTPSGGTSGKLLRFVDKIAQSKYFHKATEYKYIKKAMEGVSNTRLLLVVEVKNIAGPLAINIPPPPTDRLWYGFRRNPRLWLSAKPWVGEREVSLTHVTDWIEKKLAVEFQRVFVMPNMDDIPIPIMCDHLSTVEAQVEMP